MVMIAQYECTQCPRTALSKIVKMIHFMFCVFYHNFLKRNKWINWMSYRHILQALELNFSISTLKCYVLFFKSSYERKKALFFCCKRSRVKHHNDTLRRNCLRCLWAQGTECRQLPRLPPSYGLS